METVYGVGISRGILFGKCVFFEQKALNSSFVRVQDVKSELERWKKAVKETHRQLTELYENTVDTIGPANAMIMKVHEYILDDVLFVGKVEEQIRNLSCNAEYAVFTAGRYFAKSLSQAKDKYIKTRADDVKEVCLALIRNLGGGDRNERAAFFRMLGNRTKSESLVLVTREIFVSDVLDFERCHIRGFITKAGSAMAHASILAQSLGLVTLVGTGKNLRDAGDKDVIISGCENMAILSPDQETIEKYTRRKEMKDREKARLKDMIGKGSLTKDGRKIQVMANVTGLKDAQKAKECGADGIGLFRSEFMYLGRETAPSEQEQFEIYKELLELSGIDFVTIRTIDVGPDKTPDYFSDLAPEGSPAAVRGIRFCLTHPEVFITQLRALLRASVYGKLKILLPMITSIAEIEETKKILESLKNELNRSQIAYDKDLALGIMIETPAAVMIADKLAKVVDFFNIGTNDLTQLTFAADRNSREFSLDDTVILRMVDIAVLAAKEHDIPVSVCGVYASDVVLLGDFVGLGADSLSVPAEHIGEVKEKISELSFVEQVGTVKNKIKK
ncbi:MAG: phosphoenolpyruvate--protein phosphotransferase [Oscillospiraceae bacterium]|jgi:phosphotransferase system enzyme I (PtsI)|nr:phosphoenolpyruvate--protein phosphotransferase [Oscillospiraceae bacterium]